MTKILILAALVVGLVTACGESPGPVKKRQLAAPNPTSYIFAAPLPELRARLLAELDDFARMQPFYESFSESSFYFAKETSERPLFAPHVFADPANVHDIYLHTHGGAIESPTPVYFARGKPLRYFAQFQLHFEEIDKNNTRVSVITYGSRVANGAECCGPHGKVAIFQDVEPTSIEEYRLLEWIGRITGTKEMPPINLPVEN